jgi:hypothetical protein
MPLMHSKSKKAFGKNVEAEMKAGKPQPQALAIAYSVKRKAGKKASGGMVKSGSKDMDMARGGMMAQGGEVSASNEKRPMPQDMHNDKLMASQNRGDKPAKNDSWTDRSTVAQAQINNGRKVMPIKRPKMVPSDAFSTRLYDEEGRLQESDKPGPYGEQPPEHDNEMGPDRHGDDVPDMQDEHSTKRKPYAKGGEIEAGDGESHNMFKRTMMEPMDPPEEMYEREDQRHHMIEDAPSMDEGKMHAMELDEEERMKMGADPDMSKPHSAPKSYAEGGMAQYDDAMDHIDHEMEYNPASGKFTKSGGMTRPEDEYEEDHHDSIAAAIMAKKSRQMKMMSDSDDDEMAMMAEGGILSHDSIYSDNSDMADMSRNNDEDANEEDQLSLNALRKENYDSSYLDKDQPMNSNEHGDDEESDSENKHDMISKIMRSMKSKRQF